MNTANALYNFNGETLPVSVEPQPRRLIVHLLNGTSAQVYWYYDQVMYDERTRMFSYPGQPPQELSVTDPMLHEEVLARVRRDVKSIHRRRGSTLVKVLVLAAALIAAAYFLLVPWLAGKLAANVPVSYEKQLGDQLFASLKPTFRIDTQRTAQVNAFFRELRFASPYEIRITVVEGDVANAFALPGGHIVVYNKLLNGMNDYTELAALLAHEFTHVQGRHSLRNMFRSLS
ncbi:MAG TPA: M48 family metallopeptidase, partial [Chitinophagaceae bacterium]|nr:M48 family metallopeptidase [Chitinophagaceae bacterium]